jgi:predicted  nucleic acid-binding Zn-ribbon protein
MSEDETKVLKDTLLEQILIKLEVLDARLQRVESKIEERGFDTKPIWERALVEIMDVKQDVATVNRKIDVFSKDMLNLRADHLKTEERVDKLEAENEGGGMTTVN